MSKVPPLLALSMLILCGCSTPPPSVPPFPTPPARAMVRAPQTLETLPTPTATTKQALPVMVDNSQTYQQVRQRLDELQDWVRAQAAAWGK